LPDRRYLVKKRYLAFAAATAAGIIAAVTACTGPIAEPSWGWKLAPTPEDAHNFINGLGSYPESHAVGDIAATDQGFVVFYRGDLEGTSDWGWKLAQTPDDAHDFLNRNGAYAGEPIAETRVAYRSETELFFVYGGRSAQANWGWKRATSIDDMHNFLTGSGAYDEPKEGAIGGLGTNEILMFYGAHRSGSGSWGWKLATSIDDAHEFLNGHGSYGAPVAEAKIFATGAGHYYIFYQRR
jgi:hypothetical protein